MNKRKISKKDKNADIEKLEKEGRYIDIYEKYGEIDWVTYMIDMENELGRQPNLKERLFSKSISSRRNEKIKNFIKRLPIRIPLLSLLFTGTIEIAKLENYVVYRKEIQEYQKDIQEYSKKFDSSKQSDLEIIMKVQKDLYETIKGYGRPKIDVFGYQGIALTDKESTGVCKNFSCNIADKLNAINPKYNAREIVLYAKFGDFKNSNQGLEDLRYKITGNHTMVAIDIEQDNVTLIIDPTNFGLGVYKNGEIIIFNEKNPDESTYKRCIFGDISYNAMESLVGYPISYIKSFREPKLSLEELEEKYGLEAQNKMLDKIEKEEQNKMLDKTEKEEQKQKKQQTKNDFKSNLKVDYNFIKNTVTINKSPIKPKER